MCMEHASKVPNWVNWLMSLGNQILPSTLFMVSQTEMLIGSIMFFNLDLTRLYILAISTKTVVITITLVI